MVGAVGLIAAIALGAAPARIPAKLTVPGLFDEPRLDCRLRALLGEDYGQVRESFGLVEEVGDAQVRGWVRGLAGSMEAFIGVADGDVLYAAFLRDGDTVVYSESSTVPGRDFDPWRATDEAGHHVIRKRPARSPAECSAARLAKAIADHDRARTDTWCSAKGSRFDGAGIAFVKTSVDRAWLYAEPIPCEGAGPCASRTRSYLVARDAVELSSSVEARRGFVCISFTSGNGRRTVGWLEESALERAASEAPPPPPEAWLGTWKNRWGTVVLSAEGASGGAPRLHVEAAASAGAHTGEFSGAAAVTGSGYEAGDETCGLTLRLANNALLVAENGTCGGVGVTLSGLYHRQQQ